MPNHFLLKKVSKKELDLQIVKVVGKDWKKKKDKNEYNRLY